MHTGKRLKKNKDKFMERPDFSCLLFVFVLFVFLTFSSPAEGSYGEEKLVSLLMLQY